MIPDVTNTEENINQFLEFLNSNNGINEINILPFHKIANHKYARFQIENKMNKTNEPSKEKISRIKNLFESTGFKVSIGG